MTGPPAAAPAQPGAGKGAAIRLESGPLLSACSIRIRYVRVCVHARVARCGAASAVAARRDRGCAGLCRAVFAGCPRRQERPDAALEGQYVRGVFGTRAAFRPGSTPTPHKKVRYLVKTPVTQCTYLGSYLTLKRDRTLYVEGIEVEAGRAKLRQGRRGGGMARAGQSGRLGVIRYHFGSALGALRVAVPLRDPQRPSGRPRTGPHCETKSAFRRGRSEAGFESGRHAPHLRCPTGSEAQWPRSLVKWSSQLTWHVAPPLPTVDRIELGRSRRSRRSRRSPAHAPSKGLPSSGSGNHRYELTQYIARPGPAPSNSWGRPSGTRNMPRGACDAGLRAGGLHDVSEEQSPISCEVRLSNLRLYA